MVVTYIMELPVVWAIRTKVLKLVFKPTTLLVILVVSN